MPVLQDPSTYVKTAAIGRFRSGDTIRTDRYRFTAYSASGSEPAARMLYDHQNDPNEMVNLSEHVEKQALVGGLFQQLEMGMGRPSPR